MSNNVCPLEVHEALKRDRARWDALEVLGVPQLIPAGDGPNEPAYRLVMKNCHCGSTLAVEELA